MLQLELLHDAILQRMEVLQQTMQQTVAAPELPTAYSNARSGSHADGAHCVRQYLYAYMPSNTR